MTDEQQEGAGMWFYAILNVNVLRLICWRETNIDRPEACSGKNCIL